jgi:[acyl-carrier-protein] S-malonyltransferase
VVSGTEDRLVEFKRLAGEKGARRVIPLKVSGAFHSRLMQQAVEGLHKVISVSGFSEPLMPVIANVTAAPLTDARSVREELATQIVNCVRWRESVENMIAGGITTFVEIGHGQVLADLIKRINAEATVFNIGDVDIENQVKNLWAEQRRQHIKCLLEKAIQSEKSSHDS